MREKRSPRRWQILLVAAGWLGMSHPAPATGAAPSHLPEGVAATVNGEPIAESLITTYLKNDREALEIDPRTQEGAAMLVKLHMNILEELIERMLIAQGVKAMGVAPTEAQIDAAEAKMLDFCGSEDRYEAYTAQNGFTRQGYRDAVLRTAANGKAMAAALTKDLSVSEEEVKSYYEAHAADPDFQWPERVKAAHILINAQPGVLTMRLEHDRGLAPNSPESLKAIGEETIHRRELAEDVRRQAVAPGADFAALAKKYSEDTGTRELGGLLGTFAKGTHPLALDDVLFSLPRGEVGPVVQTEFGFHVVRVLDHQPAGPRTLSEATPEIRRRLLGTRQAERLRQWLEEAHAKATIVLREPATPPATR